MVNSDKHKFKLQIPDYIREFMSEFIGTFIQMFLGLASLMLIFISPNKAIRLHSDPEYANCTPPCRAPDGLNAQDEVYEIQLFPIYILVIGFTWASGTLGAFMISLPISGGFHNPGITISLVALSRLHWKKLLHFIPAQYLGSFIAAAALHLLYYQHIDSADADRIIGYVFIPSPHPSIKWLSMAFIDGFISCAIFAMFVFSTLDVRSNPMPNYSQPLIIVTFVFVAAMFFTINKNGIVFNPARDLGTRLYGALVLGFQRAFEDLSYCYWISQQFSMTLGFLFGSWFYVFIFGSDLQTKDNLSNANTMTNTKKSKNIGREENEITNHNKMTDQLVADKDKGIQTSSDYQNIQQNHK